MPVKYPSVIFKYGIIKGGCMSRILISILLFTLTIFSQIVLGMEYQKGDIKLIYNFNNQLDPLLTLDKADVGDVLYAHNMYIRFCGNYYDLSADDFYNLEEKLDPNKYSPSNWKINKVGDSEITVEFIVRKNTKKSDFNINVTDYDQCNDHDEVYYKEPNYMHRYLIKSIQGEASMKDAIKTLSIMATMVGH